jgi:hypothetical protein
MVNLYSFIPYFNTTRTDTQHKDCKFFNEINRLGLRGLTRLIKMDRIRLEL